jgi:hypothetical protein
MMKNDRATFQSCGSPGDGWRADSRFRHGDVLRCAALPRKHGMGVGSNRCRRRDHTDSRRGCCIACHSFCPSHRPLDRYGAWSDADRAACQRGCRGWARCAASTTCHSTVSPAGVRNSPAIHRIFGTWPFPGGHAAKAHIRGVTPRRMLFEIVSLVIGVALASLYWKAPARLLRVSAYSAFLLAVLLLALAGTGWPLFPPRLHQRPMTETAQQSLQLAHSAGGHVSLWLVSLVTPLFVAAALRHRSSPWRRLVLVIVAVFVAVGWLLVSVSGYLLPANVPNPVPRSLAPVVIRFGVLHMLGLPVLLITALLFMGWRHLRSASQLVAV